MTPLEVARGGAGGSSGRRGDYHDERYMTPLEVARGGAHAFVFVFIVLHIARILPPSDNLLIQDFRIPCIVVAMKVGSCFFYWEHVLISGLQSQQ